MNKTTKILSVVMLFVFSCVLYAMNKEYLFTDFLSDTYVTDNDKTSPFIEDDVVLQEEKSNQVQRTVNGTVLFSDDFEGIGSKWTFVNSAKAEWYIGTATKSTGTKALYISDDKGVSNHYVSDDNVSHAISDLIAVPQGTTEVNFEYDWRSDGEFIGSSVYDYGQVWIVPSSYTPKAGSMISASSGGILVHDKMGFQKSYKSENRLVDISKFAGTNIKLVFLWMDDFYGENQPPLSIDNVSLTIPSCPKPGGVKVTTKTTNAVTIEWNQLATGKSIELYNSTVNTAPVASATGIVISSGTSHTISSLTPGTDYFIWYRANCGANDVGDWVGPIKTNTLCVALNVPLNETFGSTSNTLKCWTIIDVNNDATSPTGSNIWKTTTSGTFIGDQAMYFSGASAIAQHDDWLVSPVLILTGKMYKITYQYKTSSSNDNDFEFSMTTNGSDFTGVTPLVTHKKVNQTTYKEETVYVKNITGNARFGFHVNAKKACTIYIGAFNIEEVSCADPVNVKISNEKSNSADVSWTDTLNTDWEYYVQDMGSPLPVGSGVKTKSKSFTVNQLTATSTPLQPQSIYEFYVRSDCGGGNYGAWQGPFVFVTPCINALLPFNEDFEVTSTTIDCWQITDVNGDGNIWKAQAGVGVNNSRGMSFVGDSWPAVQHNDWLISPTVRLLANTSYQLSYKYKTDSSSWSDNRFSVKLSTTGKSISSFTTVLLPTKKYTNDNYVTEIITIPTGIVGDVNIAWQVGGNGECYIYLDDVSIKQIDCITPKLDSNTSISGLTSNSATISWTDSSTSNTSYNYYVQATGLVAPTGGGSNTTNKNVMVTSVNTAGGGALQPDTEYDFYVRSSCGTGKYSDWVGPIKFRTKCANQNSPFWEGFNTNSTTTNCWTCIDKLGKSGTISDSKRWRFDTWDVYEGDRALSFSSDWNDSSNDDWLISPSVTTVATKYYRLKYHYLADTWGWSDASLKVALSTTGANVAGMTTTLVPTKVINNDVYKEENVIFKGVAGTVNIGFYIGSDDASMYLDNFFVEEVVGCPEPSDLGAKDEKGNSATIYWDQKFEGSEWEYYVQLPGLGMPSATATGGVKVKTKQAIADKDAKGNKLKNNTEYEFYVRTVCSATANSIWAGPFKFMTACGVFDTPFNEGFNTSSGTLRCWTIIDNNKDATIPTGNNIWHTTKSIKYEGNGAMEFTGTSGKTHDDWLISPTVKFNANKIYRVKYYYRTSGVTANKNEFELLLSKSGTGVGSFTTVVKTKQVYANTTDWKQEYLFITGQTGDVNLAFHVVSTGATNIFVDQFSIEEVENCPEPINLDVTNVTHNEGTLSWTDDFGATKFEYFVQEVGKRVPRLNDRGTPIMGKTVVANKDNRTRLALLPNTDYEFYVRTLCSDKSYSIWNGPVKFRTLCGVYQSPFIETFNTDSKSIRCWNVLDPSNNGTLTGGNLWKVNDFKDPFEGDGHASYTGLTGKLHNGWLVSPQIDLDGGQYVLKYRYKTTKNNNNEFEVMLSTNGMAPASFTHTLVSKKVYNNDQYVEEVVYFDNIKGIANIGWHVTTNGATTVYVDKVEVKKISTCPEPYKIIVTGQTSNSIDVSWQEQGTATSWEVIVVETGTDIPSQPTQVVTVNGTPSATISNLQSNKFYTVYVRSICSDKVSRSDWSSGKDTYTKVGANDECSGAIKLTANTNLEDCKEVFKGVTDGMSMSTAVRPSCWNAGATMIDQWFEFTPTNAINVFKLNNLINLATGAKDTGTFSLAIYDVGCTGITATAKWCTTLSPTNVLGYQITNMVPGQKYLIRLGYMPTGANRHSFELCIGSHNGKYLEVVPSQPAEAGNPDDPDFKPDPAKPYTIDKLVKDVLVKSNCKLVSNVRYQNGDGSADAMKYNTIGYFNKGQTDFPFNEGIVLSTNEVQYVPGPSKPSSFDFRGANDKRWTGDKDVNDVINDAGGGPNNNKRVTQLEFDFVPIKEVLKFEYLFASNSYHSDCSSVGCQAGALFAAWLIDSETGKGVNLAKVNGTDTPIALNTVVDHTKTTKSCTSMNADLYWRHYDDNTNRKLGAYIDFVGLTKAMESDEVFVVPGRKYHIKLAVIDFCSTTAHSSAAFFKAGSFDLGDLDLGADLTVDNDNAICNTESRTIESGLGTENVDIKWFKDDVEVKGETKPSLEVTESGLYRVEAFYKNIQCAVKGEIRTEIYPAISEIVAKTKDVYICRYSLGKQKVDLKAVIDQMFEGVDRSHYMVQAYRTEEDLEYSLNEIKNLLEYEIQPNGKEEHVYFRIEDKRTGCMEVFPLTIKLETGETPSRPKDEVVCGSYTLPALPDNQKYYSQSGAKGENYMNGHVFGTGEYEIYILQDNGHGCYEETSFKVEVTAPVVAHQFADVVRECELYELIDLKDGSKYYTEVNGVRIELQPGTVITTTNTRIYVEIKSENGVCYDESSFLITYNDCPMPKGFSPNGDGVNDVFDLSAHGVTSVKIFNRNGAEVFTFKGIYTNQWTGKDKSNKDLPSGTYYYVIEAFGKTRTGWVQLNR